MSSIKYEILMLGCILIKTVYDIEQVSSQLH